MARKSGRKRRQQQPAVRAESVPASRPVAVPGWIISPLWDTVLFIAAPIVSIAALYPWRAFWPSQQYAAFLLAFLTFGHHLPGFIRAYGDRELFARYRWRFLLAPPLIFAASLYFQQRGLHGFVMLTFTWDIWHVLMQHYGFMRIYDAKQRELRPLTARLDWAFSISAYVALIVASPHYRNNLLYLAYQSGVPLLSGQLYSFLETSIYAVTGMVAAGYVVYNAYLWKAGRLNVRKLVTLGTFLAATYFLYVHTDDFAVGFAVWSGFHCLQYYGIVWVFNRSRVDKGGAVTRFVQFLFRPRTALVLLYASLILLYGGIDYMQHFVADQTVYTVLLSFIATSALLHYYYDGFIWKVREKDTRQNLEIVAERPVAPESLVRSSARTALVWLRRLQPSYQRGLYQAGYLTAALLILGSLEIWRPNDDLAMNESLVVVAAETEEAHLRLGQSLRQRGRLPEAIEAYREAVTLDPSYAKVHVMLGLSLAGQGQVQEAARAYELALEADPSIGEAHFNLAALLENRGDLAEAQQHYQKAAQSQDEQVRDLARAALGRLRSPR